MIHSVPVQIVQKAADLQEAISEGATSFLLTEYKYMGVFMVCHQYLPNNACGGAGSDHFTRSPTDAASGMLQGVPILYKIMAFAASSGTLCAGS